MIREKIVQMISESPRTTKELADALGLSKQEVLGHLTRLPVESMRTVSRNGRARPVSVVHHVLK